MARTESCSFQVHPNDEQSQINLMEKFHWSLLNSQEIKTVDNHMEQRGDSICSVTNTEHYVKLTLSRALSLANLQEIRELEQQFNALPHPVYPKLFPGSIGLWLFASLFWGAGIIGWAVYFFSLYSPKKKDAEELSLQNGSIRGEVLQQLEQYS